MLYPKKLKASRKKPFGFSSTTCLGFSSSEEVSESTGAFGNTSANGSTSGSYYCFGSTTGGGSTLIPKAENPVWGFGTYFGPVGLTPPIYDFIFIYANMSGDIVSCEGGLRLSPENILELLLSFDVLTEVFGDYCYWLTLRPENILVGGFYC